MSAYRSRPLFWWQHSSLYLCFCQDRPDVLLWGFFNQIKQSKETGLSKSTFQLTDICNNYQGKQWYKMKYKQYEGTIYCTKNYYNPCILSVYHENSMHHSQSSLISHHSISCQSLLTQSGQVKYQVTLLTRVACGFSWKINNLKIQTGSHMTYCIFHADLSRWRRSCRCPPWRWWSTVGKRRPRRCQQSYSDNWTRGPQSGTGTWKDTLLNKWINK